MKMKILAFGCGMFTGMACLCLLPPIREKMMHEMKKASRKMQSTKQVLLTKGKQLKHDVEDAASDISSDIKDLADSIVDEMDSIDTKGLSTSLKKTLGKIKTHAVSLKNLTK